MFDQSVPLLSVRELKKYFPAKNKNIVKAIDDISFDIYSGETFSLVGESGCGKTTCGRTVLGLYTKTAGQILYHGSEIQDFKGQDKKRFYKNAQMIFQDPYACLDPRMTVGSIIQEGICVHFKLTKEEREERVKHILEKVGLTPDFAARFPNELSGGQRQRIGIARALAIEPEFIVCDEPIAALDVSIQAQIINLMIKLQKEMGLTYLFISHDLSMVRHISDRIGVMYLGAMVELSFVDNIYNNPCHPYTQALFSSILLSDLEGNKSQQRIRLEGEIPSPINPPSGCKFRTRCRYAKDICSCQAPELKQVEEGHYVACHLY